MECEFVGLALPEGKGEQLRVDVLECFEPKGSIREGMLIPVHGVTGRAGFPHRETGCYGHCGTSGAGNLISILALPLGPTNRRWLPKG